MEPIVQAAVISGMAVITAASIQAAGNVVATRKRLAEKPAPKEMAHDNITDHRIKVKVDWVFWGILAFTAVLWVGIMAKGEVIESRYTLSLAILMPSTASFMVTAKVLRLIVDSRRR